MTELFAVHYRYIFLTTLLIFGKISLYSIQQNTIQLTEQEINLISDNQNTPYVYLGSEDILRIINELNSMDDSDSSPLRTLNEYLKKNSRLIEYDIALEFLDYAEGLLQKRSNLSNPSLQQLQRKFDEMDRSITEDKLTIYASTVRKAADNQNTIALLPTSLHAIDPNFSNDDNFGATRLITKTPALVVSTTNETLSGLTTVDGVSLAVNDRLLLIGQTNAVENGLWLAQSGAWTRPADFNTGNLADEAYVLISSGSTNAGSSWLSTTPLAVIDTDPINFTLFSLPDVTTGANVGTGAGLVFRDKTGTVLNFKSLKAASGVLITNNADEIIIDTSETSGASSNTIVARNNTGGFSATTISMTDGVITSSLTVTPFNTTGILHNDASGQLSTSLITNADISASASIADSKLATITTAGKVSNAATTANSANLANAIVARDGLGNFSAGTITANLSGNATSANTATSATTATNFSGTLSGDVTGVQGATVVSMVGGQNATNIANSTVLANAATSANSANAIIRRDATGRFSAGAISVTDVVISNGLTVTPLSVAGVVHNNVSGVFSTSLIVNADISASAAIADSKLATISTAGKVANTATTASSVNSANTIVSRDASGNFSANTIVATLNGTATNNLLRSGDTMTGSLQLPAGTSAAPSLNFTGSTTTGLSASSSNLSLNTNGIERIRISSGGIVSIKPFTTAGIVKNDSLGNLSTGLIVDSNISSSAGILDTKLATISTPGKITNSATTATSANTANSIVSRDSQGNFSANKITSVDSAINGNLILSTDPSTSTAGNIFKGVNTPFIHNFGIDNTFMGSNVANFTMTGGQNSAIGSLAFTANTSGENNVAIGFSSLPECTTGSNNIAIGSIAGATLTTGSGNIYINANAAASNETTTIRIGTSQTRCFIAGIRSRTTGNANAVSVLIDSAGQLGTISSSRKYKTNIQDMGTTSAPVMALRPVTFNYKKDPTNTLQFGLIAEEVESIMPEIVARDDNGNPETIQYHILPVLLLNELKKHHAIISDQSNLLNQQAVTIQNMRVTLDMMKEAIRSLQKEIEKLSRK